MRKTIARMAAKALVSSQAGWLGDCRLVLHIGLHKTGTTYLQQQLSAARRDLHDQGLLFPTTGMTTGIFVGPRAGKMVGHGSFGRMFSASDWMLAGLLLSLLAREARAENCREILISTENASYVRRPGKSTLGRYFLGRFGQVDILVYLRRWDHWIESLYKERVSTGETRDFPTFLAEEAWLLDYPVRLAAWEALCGSTIRLRVFDYDRVRQDGSLLEQVFRDVFPGIATPLERAGRVNPSLNVAQTEALRHFNITNAGAPRSRDRADAFQDAGFLAIEGPDGYFTDSERKAFLSGFSAQNTLLKERHGIDLLGTG